MLISLVGLSLIIFTTSRLLPGNPARLALGPNASEQQVQELARSMGLHKPIHLQYVDFVQGFLSGDLGRSIYYDEPVSENIVHFLPATLELITVAMFFTVVLGVGLGVVAAVHKNGVVDSLSRTTAFFSVSVPGFFVAILFQFVLAYLLGWFPITGRLASQYGDTLTRITGFYLIDTLLVGNIDAHINAWRHLILPALSLSLVGMGQTMRITRSTMIDVLGKDYIEASRGYGLPDWIVLYKYALKSAMIAPLTILGLLYASLLGNAFLVELVFSWPGLATYGVTAVLKNDVNAIVGVTMTVGVVFVSVNFLIDLMIQRIDPRITPSSEGQF
jgi:peptide/nickel transport system permease protein